MLSDSRKQELSKYKEQRDSESLESPKREIAPKYANQFELSPISVCTRRPDLAQLLNATNYAQVDKKTDLQNSNTAIQKRLIKVEQNPTLALKRPYSYPR